jgi:Na+-driven multidrug efflux pump
MVIAVSLYPVRLGFYYLTYGRLGADAIWLSFPVSAVAGLAVGFSFYRYSNWRRHEVPETSEEAQEQSNTDGEPAGRYAPTL